MAVKKSELYSSLWSSCDQLRGGMDASLYKDYILTLLFVKYVTDKFSGDRYAEIEIPEGGSFHDMVAAKGKSDIGEQMNKIIAKLALENKLSGVIDLADFDDNNKLGSGKDKVDRLTNLVAIFENEALDFRKNRAGGDDIIGDANEYFMKKFATESGKSKGQFYTPAEVSRIMAKVIGISTATLASQTVYDPACGSGSLLIRAADEASVNLTIYGQEFDTSTAGLAKMNLVLHNKAAGTIEQGNTLSFPKYKDRNDKDKPERFDFAVANPPFSYKSWHNGIDAGSDERFMGFGALPPAKNGDYAWLMHFIYSLKPEKGKGAIILPHGVLFRGNTEETIRKAIMKKKIIKGIIGLPANLFYGTSIPACIIVIDKENAAARKGLFMIDASKGFMKDGNKNRLREQDIHKIVDTFNKFKEIKKYSRMVPYCEIEANDYNLNIPRYIDTSEPEDMQDIKAHLKGGIPQNDIDNLARYWAVFPSLQNELFQLSERDGYLKLKIVKDNISETIYQNSEFINYARKVKESFDDWKESQLQRLNDISKDDKPKEFIVELSDTLLEKFAALSLIDKYDVYQCLMSYWEETMQDDLYALVFDGWDYGREIEYEMVKKKDGTITSKRKSFEGRLIPKELLIERYFPEKQRAITDLKNKLDECTELMNEQKEEQGTEEGLLAEVIDDKGNITKTELNKRLKEIKSDDDYADEWTALKEYERLMSIESKYKEEIRKAATALDGMLIKKYDELSIAEIKELTIEQKWCADILEAINDVYSAISHRLTNRVLELVERYEKTLPQLEEDVAGYEVKVKSHLERMGFEW